MLNILYKYLRTRFSAFFHNWKVYLIQEIQDFKNEYLYRVVTRINDSSAMTKYLDNRDDYKDPRQFYVISGRFHLLGELDKAKFYAKKAEDLKTRLRKESAPFDSDFVWAGGDWVSNIGHTAMGLDILRCKMLSEGVDVPIFFYSYGQGNSALLRIFSEHLRLFKLSQKDYYDFERTFRNSEIQLSFISNQTDLLEIHEAYKHYNRAALPHKRRVELLEEQTDIARTSLDRMGVDLKVPFIAFHVREKDEQDALRQGNQGDLENVVRALTHFSNFGYQFIRMGHKGMTPLDKVLRNESDVVRRSFFDYANSNEKSEVVDLFLWANCEFFIGGDSGPIMVPPLFFKPTLRVNTNMPYMHNVGHSGFILPKLVSHKKSSQFIPFRELKNSYTLMHKTTTNSEFVRHFVTTEVIIDAISDMISLNESISQGEVIFDENYTFDLQISPSFAKRYQSLF